MARRAKKRATPRKKIKRLTEKQIDRMLCDTAADKRAALANKKAHWSTCRALQKEVDKLWVQLKNKIQKGAHPLDILHSKNKLFLVLGECDYMIREYQRQSSRAA